MSTEEASHNPEADALREWFLRVNEETAKLVAEEDEMLEELIARDQLPSFSSD